MGAQFDLRGVNLDVLVIAGEIIAIITSTNCYVVDYPRCCFSKIKILGNLIYYFWMFKSGW